MVGYSCLVFSLRSFGKALKFEKTCIREKLCVKQIPNSEVMSNIENLEIISVFSLDPFKIITVCY